MFARRRTFAAAALLPPVLAAASCALIRDQTPRTRSLGLEVLSVPLDPRDPTKTSIGRLRYRGGLWLRSEDPRFGGLSDLRVSDDGKTFEAISDCGAVLEARLEYDSRNFLSGLRMPNLDPLLGPGGRPLGRGEVDAEALARDGEGGFVVSFEGRRHLWRYAGPEGLRGNPTPMPAPAGLADCDPNAGVEAMTRLPDGRLLLLSEGRERGQPRVAPGWLGLDTTWSTLSYPLFYDPGIPQQPYHPTSVTLLPGSEDVLVLERRYPPVAARIRRVGRAAFERGDGLEGVELARFDPPLTLDNFEGIEASVGPRGETLVFLVSDDNNCAKSPGDVRHSSQRTLLLLFELS